MFWEEIDQLAELLDAGFFGFFVEVDGAADFRVHLGAAEGFGIDLLADRGLHQRRAGQVKLAAFGHQEFVAEHGQIRSAGDAIAHDGGVLRHAHGAEHRVVAEDPAEVVLVGKNLVLHGQKNAGAVDEIDQGEIATRCDLLGTQDFLHGRGEERAGFHRGIVGDDHAGTIVNRADAGDHTCADRAANFFVHAVRGPEI